MADFPSIQYPSSRKRTFNKPQIRTEFENGYVQSRARVTRGRWLFELTWDLLSVSDFNTLQEHFDTECGYAFVVSANMLYTGSDKTCRYSEDTLTAESAEAGYYKVTVQLEEV